MSIDSKLAELQKQFEEHRDKFPFELHKLQEGIKEVAITKRAGLEDELAMLATKIQKKAAGETYEQAFVRATETEEGQKIRQEMQELYVTTGI